MIQIDIISRLISDDVHAMSGLLTDNGGRMICESIAGFFSDISNNPRDPTSYAIMADFVDDNLNMPKVASFLRTSASIPAALNAIIRRATRARQDGDDEALAGLVQAYDGVHANITAIHRRYQAALRQCGGSVTIRDQPPDSFRFVRDHPEAEAVTIRAGTELMRFMLTPDGIDGDHPQTEAGMVVFAVVALFRLINSLIKEIDGLLYD